MFVVKSIVIQMNGQVMDLSILGQCLATKALLMGGSLSILRYDLSNGFTYLQLGRDFINLFLFKYMPF